MAPATPDLGPSVAPLRPCPFVLGEMSGETKDEECLAKAQASTTYKRRGSGSMLSGKPAPMSSEPDDLWDDGPVMTKGGRISKSRRRGIQRASPEEVEDMMREASKVRAAGFAKHKAAEKAEKAETAEKAEKVEEV